MRNHTPDLFSGQGCTSVHERGDWRANRNKVSFGRLADRRRVVNIARIGEQAIVPTILAATASATNSLDNTHARYIVSLESGENALICFDPAWLDFLEEGPAGLDKHRGEDGRWQPLPNLVFAYSNFFQTISPNNWANRRERSLDEFSGLTELSFSPLFGAQWVTAHGPLAEDLVLASLQNAYYAKAIRTDVIYPTHSYVYGHRDGGADFVIKHIGKRKHHLISVKGSAAKNSEAFIFGKPNAWRAVRGSVGKTSGEEALGPARPRRLNSCLTLGLPHPSGGTFDTHALRSIMTVGKKVVVPVLEDAFLDGWVLAYGPDGTREDRQMRVPTFPLQFLVLSE